MSYNAKEPMLCCICTKVALYYAGKKGFCKDHKQDAIKEETILRSKRKAKTITEESREK